MMCAPRSRNSPPWSGTWWSSPATTRCPMWSRRSISPTSSTGRSRGYDAAHRAPRRVHATSWWVLGESGALERAVTNLLDNAAKWGIVDGTITVRLDGGILTVDDQGPGILPGRHAAHLRALLPLQGVACAAWFGVGPLDRRPDRGSASGLRRGKQPAWRWSPDHHGAAGLVAAAVPRRARPVTRVNHPALPNRCASRCCPHWRAKARSRQDGGRRSS